MSKYNYLITCAGWEDRFVDSVLEGAKSNDVDQIIVFTISEFEEKTRINIAKLKDTLGENIINQVEILILDDVGAWKCIERFFCDNEILQKNICVDITTMPRFLIWFVMHYVDRYGNVVDYVYFKPSRYEKCNWLTSDAGTPRLVFKHSGIHLPDTPTVLIIQTGFDIERVNQMIFTYEPEKVLIAAQVGDQFDNVSENIKKHRERLKYQSIEHFEVDAFGGDYGFKALEDKVLQLKDCYNVIISSFGPKPMAVTMFYLNKKYPELGMSYVLVKNYNSQYSHGIDIGDAVHISPSVF